MQVLAPYFDNSLMQVILVMVSADAALGILIAGISGKFQLNKLAYFLHDSFLPYVVVFAIVEIISETVPAWVWLEPTVFVLIVVSVVANIFGNLAKAGLPCPKFLQKD